MTLNVHKLRNVLDSIDGRRDVRVNIGGATHTAVEVRVDEDGVLVKA